MTDTNCSTGGTARPNRRAAGSRRSWRWTVPALVPVVALLVWSEVRVQQRVAELERRLTTGPVTEACPPFVLREQIESLNRSLLQFQLSGDPAEKDEFTRQSQAAGRLLDRFPGATAETEPALAAVREALEDYLAQAASRLEQPLRTIRRDSAATVRQELVAISSTLRARSDELLGLWQSAALAAGLQMRNEISSLGRWLLWSRGLWVTGSALLLTVLGWLAYRGSAAVQPAENSPEGRRERLASLGVLAAGVAHEIRNPLTAIKFRLFSVRQALPTELVDNEDLGIIENEIHRLDRIVKGFLQFARPPEPHPTVFPVDRLLEGVRDLLQNELRARSIELATASAPGLELHADEPQLQQVLINLVQNAADAVDGEGRITLAARLGAARLLGSSQPVVILEVADTGKGIPPEAEARLFEPFFSTKRGGTGLGLAIAARIIELHGGELQYTTAPSRGTTFSILLPRPARHESAHPAH